MGRKKFGALITISKSFEYSKQVTDKISTISTTFLWIFLAFKLILKKILYEHQRPTDQYINFSKWEVKHLVGINSEKPGPEFLVTILYHI